MEHLHGEVAPGEDPSLPALAEEVPLQHELLVCREREGNTRQFYCIYHGWSYNTDGSLKNMGVPLSPLVSTMSWKPSWSRSTATAPQP